MLSIFLLDMWEDPNTYLAIGAMIAAFASVAGLIFTIRQASDARYLEFIKNIDTELTEHLEKELKLDGEAACIVHSYNYIDICDRIAFLIENKKIRPEFLDYYYDFFNYAITVLWWYTTNEEDNRSLEYSWPPLIRWIVRGEGKPYPVKHLPEKMVELLSETEKNTDQNTLYSQLVDRIKTARKNHAESQSGS